MTVGAGARLFGAAVLVVAVTACSTTGAPRPAAPEPDRADTTPANVDAPSTQPKAPDAPPLPAPAPEPEPAPTPAPTPEPDAPEPAPAPEPAAPTEPPPAASRTVGGSMLERSRTRMHAGTEWLARRIDGFFGDRPHGDEPLVREGRIGLSLLKRETESIEARVRFNARVRLPNLEERAYVFVGRDNEEEVIRDTPEELSRQDRLLSEQPGQRSFFAGLGIAVREAFDFRLGFRGVRPYAQARFRHVWRPALDDLVEFRQTFFWRNRDGFGSTTALSYEHLFTSTIVLRSLTAATISERSRRYDLSSLLGVYKTFGTDRLLSLEGIVSSFERTGVKIDDYGLQVKWLQPIHQDWVLGEVVVGHFWPRPDPTVQRARRWAVGGTVTLLF